MKQGDRNEPPAEDQHGGRHPGRAAADDENDDNQKAEKRGDDERWRYDGLPGRCAARLEEEDYDRGAQSSISNRRPGGEKARAVIPILPVLRVAEAPCPKPRS